MDNIIRIPNYMRYSNDDMDVFEAEEGNYCYLHVKKNDKYYYKRGRAKECLGSYYASLENSGIKAPGIQWLDIVGYTMILISPVFLVRLFVAAFMDFKNISLGSMALGVAFMIVNIILHEMAHSITLKAYGGRSCLPKIKFEKGVMKATVNTSTSYLLPPYKRIIVYMAGLLANILTCFVADKVGMPANCMIFTLALIVINLIPSKIHKNDMTQTIGAIRECVNRFKDMEGGENHG